MRKRMMILVCVFLGIYLVGASFDVGGFEVGNSYSGGELITGFFNMSFSSQGNGNFTSNWGGKITLLELLKNSLYDSGAEYACSPKNCMRGYSSSNGVTGKSINLISGEKQLFGFVFGENDVALVEGGFKFNLDSDSSKSCINQIKIDLLNDGTIDLVNNNYLNETCTSKTYGCFDSTEDLNVKDISSNPYCEKIVLPASAAYRVGANVKKIGSDSGLLKMEMYDAETLDSLGNGCDLTGGDSGWINLDCIVNYSGKSQFSALVCISLESGGYQINSENGGVNCGVWGAGSTIGSNVDYEIYAQSLRYAPVHLTLGDIESVYAMQNYIDEVYEGDCTEKCVIPFSIFGNNQILTINGIEIKYESDSGIGTSNKIYEVSEQDFTITSDGYLDFKIEEIGIYAPNATGKRDLEIDFSGTEIIDYSINITTGFNFDIKPKLALIGQTTIFEAVTSKNITSSSWNFGDGGTSVSNSVKTSHKYTEEGTFELDVSLISSSGEKSTKKFNVVVGEARTSANITLIKYEERLTNITSQINSLEGWIKVEVENYLDIDKLKSEVGQLRKDFASTTLDEDYIDIVESLLLLDIPYSISSSIGGELPIEAGLNFIDVSYIEEVSNREILDEEKAEGEIIGWIAQNYDVSVEFETLSSFSDEGKEDLLTKFIFKINKIGNLDFGQTYLFIDFPISEIIFKESYGEKSIGGDSATYIPLPGSGNVAFSISGQVGVEDLGAYISPDISKLSLSDWGILPPGITKTFKTTGFIILITILIVVTLVVYVMLQEWYKRRYEFYLFRDKDELYNLINFIYNGRKSGLKNSEIRRKLSDSRWSDEQITYAFKKMDGKRTGMFEIPIFKFFENREVERQIQMRQGKMIDIKLIKGPRF